MKHNTRFGWGVILICLMAFTAIAILSAQIFEYVPHSEDEVAYIFQAKLYAQNRLAVPTPPLDSAFWSPFIVDYQGWRFGNKPPGWSALLSLGVRVGSPWLVNAVLAVLTLALIAKLGQNFYNSTTGLLGAGLALITPGFLFLSSSLLSHTASLFWATLALLFLFYLTTRHSHQPLYALGVGASLGMAFLTRPFAGLGVGLPMGIFLLYLVVKRNLQWPHLAWVIAGGLPVAALLPLYLWAISGTPAFNPFQQVWPYDKMGFGPDVGPQGYTLYDAIFLNTRLKLLVLANGLFGWPGWTNLLFIPIPFIAHRYVNRWDWLLLSTIFGLIFIHNFYWSFGGVDGGFPRYYYDALPAFVLLTARGIMIAVDYLRPKQVGKLHLPWLLVAVIIGFVTYSFIWIMPPLLVEQKGKYGITPAPLHRVAQANLTEPALIMVQNAQDWHNFAAPFSANSPTLGGPVVYAIDWGPEYTRQVRQLFPNRQCWELSEENLQPCAALE